MIKRIDLPIWFSPLTLILLCLSLAAFSQDSRLHPPAEQKPISTLRVQAREVLLLVTVRDKHGALVSNLQKSDFTLSDNERPQTIKSFSRETNLPFQIGLLVDTSRSVSSALENERKTAGKFVDEMLPSQSDAQPAAQMDQAFVIHFDREVELLQDFTSSREKLHHQIDEMGPTKDTQRDRQSSGTSGENRDRRRRFGGTQLYDALFLASDELMKGNDGRKALVVFSDGVDRGSSETLNNAVDATDKANVVVYTIYFKGEEAHGGGYGSPGGGRRGGGYPGGVGFPGGGQRPGGGQHPGRGGREPEVDGKKVMEQIAMRTGGRFFEAKKKETLDEIYSQITDELRAQYLLTYTPNVIDNDGGYHKVALKAAKADLTVMTREGYYSPRADASK